MANAATLTVCATGCDYETVQGAIDNAGEGDTIRLMDAVHTEAGILIWSAATNFNQITIEGQGIDKTVLQAANSVGAAEDRVLTIWEQDVTIRNLTIANGSCLTSAGVSTTCYDWASNWGGGVLAGFSIITMEDVRIRDSVADGLGGGLLTGISSVSLNRVEVIGNASNGFGEGGGFASFFDSQVEVIDSTIDGNEANFGGGIQVEGSPVTISGSTISNNSARFSGGGVLINARGNYPFVQIRNSTLSGNSAPNFGSAVSVFSVNGGWGVGWLVNSTVTDSTSFGGAVHAWAFGAYSGAEYVLTNSIVANQSSGTDCSSYSPDAYAGSYDDGSNIDSDYSCHLVAPSSQPGVDPFLGPLQDNGGPTLTHGIASVASPALDWIGLGCGPGAFVEFDQRGVERPQGAQCDVGAFELDPYSALQLLYDGVDGLIGGGFLNDGQGNALTSKLDAAWADLEKGNANAAQGVLGAFINQLEDFVADGLLTPEQAEALIETAEWVSGAIATP